MDPQREASGERSATSRAPAAPEQQGPKGSQGSQQWQPLHSSAVDQLPPMDLSEPDVLHEEQLQGQSIMQRILEGTWPSSDRVELVEEEAAQPAPHVDRYSFHKRVVRGSNKKPCDSCGHEFFYGDIFYQQHFNWGGECEKLCQSCFNARFGADSDTSSMKSESLEEAEEDESQLQFDTVAVQPLHADPQLQELASQGGSMGGLPHHIRQEMHRLLGPGEAGLMPTTPADSAAPPPVTPAQQAQGRVYPEVTGLPLPSIGAESPMPAAATDASPLQPSIIDAKDPAAGAAPSQAVAPGLPDKWP